MEMKMTYSATYKLFLSKLSFTEADLGALMHTDHEAGLAAAFEAFADAVADFDDREDGGEIIWNTADYINMHYTRAEQEDESGMNDSVWMSFANAAAKALDNATAALKAL